MLHHISKEKNCTA